MTTTPPFALRTRSAREPEPDLTAIVVVHRAIRQDLRRLAVCLAGTAAQGTPLSRPPSRTRAIGCYTAALLAEIRAHHRGEDDIIWPVIAATAGQAVDLTPLTDDHRAIDAAASRVGQALARFRADPGTRAGLHASVSELRDMLEEHIADEEEQIFPAMRRYLPDEAYRWCRKQIQCQAPLPGRRFTAPWLARHARPDELSRLLATGGRPAAILLAAARPGYARLERRAFGTSPATPDTSHGPNRTSKSTRGVTMFQSHLRQLAAALVAVTVGLLASAVGVTAAFASEVPLATVHHAATTGSLTAWQIALTVVGPTTTVAVAVVLTTRIVRRRDARRAAPSPTV